MSQASANPKRAEESKQAAAVDRISLATAAAAIEQEALTSHALHRPLPYKAPAKILAGSDYALIHKARQKFGATRATNTESVMGPVPAALTHGRSGKPHHPHVAVSHELQRFSHSASDPGALGVGMHRKSAGSWPARWQRPDGIFVDPRVPAASYQTVGDVAIRTALRVLGQPYVWAAAGPRTFDCSGLVQWAYAHAGVQFGHYTGLQWGEGVHVPPADILPGDLIVFGNPTYHVGIYLGAGWMINAPYTGQYVDVVPVPEGVAGLVRP